MVRICKTCKLSGHPDKGIYRCRIVGFDENDNPLFGMRPTTTRSCCEQDIRKLKDEYEELGGYFSERRNGLELATRYLIWVIFLNELLAEISPAVNASPAEEEEPSISPTVNASPAEEEEPSISPAPSIKRKRSLSPSTPPRKRRRSPTPQEYDENDPFPME